jgi:hypothetical protein
MFAVFTCHLDLYLETHSKSSVCGYNLNKQIKQGWRKRINEAMKEKDRKESVKNKIRQEDVTHFMALSPS